MPRRPKKSRTGSTAWSRGTRYRSGGANRRPSTSIQIRLVIPFRDGCASAGGPPRAQSHTDTSRRTPLHIYVSMRAKTASATFRARMTLTSPVEHRGSERRVAHVRVWSMVTGGECLISAWNLCSTRLAPLFNSPRVKATALLQYVKDVAETGQGRCAPAARPGKACRRRHAPALQIDQIDNATMLTMYL